MKEGEPVEPPYALTHDYVHEDTGRSGARGSYRIRVYEKPGEIPVVLVGRADAEHPAGVSTITQYLAAEVLARHFTRRLWEERPLRWIGEEGKLHRDKGELVERQEFWEVEFRSFLPHTVRIFGEERIQIVETTRRPLKVREVERLFGRKP